MANKEVHQPPKTSPPFFYGYIVALAASFILLIMYGARVSYGVFFKPIINEFGWTRALTSGAFSLSMIVQGLVGIVMGRLNDKFGPRFVMTLCGFFLGLGYLLMSQIDTAWQLYLFYVVLIGTGMGGAFVPLFSTVARWFVLRRSMMAGVVFAGLGIGHLIIPPVVNWLISIYDWRLSYVIVGGVVLIICILVAQLLKRDPSKMGLVPYGANKVKEQRSDSGDEGFELKEVAYTKQFWMIFTMFLCLGLCIVSIAIHIVPHATDLGISAATAANMLTIIGGAHLLGGILCGHLADRIGNRQVFFICFILMSLALFWLMTISSVWMLSIFAFIYGFGGGGGATIESPLVAEQFGIRSHGLIFGITNFGFTIGAAIGPFLTGYIFDLTGSYQMAFLVCAIIGAVGFILAAILRPLKKISTPKSFTSSQLS